MRVNQRVEERITIQIDGLYVHFPFCHVMCGYCGFIKFHPNPTLDAYPNLIRDELRILTTEYGIDLSPKTIFLGGGSPAINDGTLFSNVLKHLKTFVSFEKMTEFTVETNPDQLSPRFLEMLQTSGVNRVSVGIQSTFSGLLLNLRRCIPTLDATHLKNLRRIPNLSINFDILFGIPGLNLSTLKQTLREILVFEPDHLSTYELTLPRSHPSYPYVPQEQTVVAQYEAIIETLQHNGFIHYEVSNFAKPGHFCKHNLLYWSLRNVLGLGIAAHTSLNTRFTPDDPLTNVNYSNASTFKRYRQQLTSNTHPFRKTPPETGKDTKKLFIIAHLRKHAGISKKAYHQAFHTSFDTDFRNALPILSTQGLVTLTQDRCYPTQKGWLVMNHMLSHLFEDLD